MPAEGATIVDDVAYATECTGTVSEADSRSLPNNATYMQYDSLLNQSLIRVETEDLGSIKSALQRLAWVAYLGDEQSFTDAEADKVLAGEAHLCAGWEALRSAAIQELLLPILRCRSEGGSMEFWFANWFVQAFLCAGYLAHRISDKVSGLDFADLLFDEKWRDVLAFRFSCHTPEVCLRLVGRCAGSGLVQHLNRFLTVSRCIVQLDLGCNQLGPGEVKVLVDALASNQTLRWLMLGSNLVGDEGAAHVAQYLAKGSSLKGLSLRSCWIRETGATAMAAALQQGTSLEHLCLASNRIGDWGAEGLAMALPGTKLRSLDLSGCAIGSRGAQQLGKGITLTPTLRNVDLAGNDVSESGANQLVGSMQNHRQLKHMSLGFADAQGRVQQSALRTGHFDGLEFAATRPSQPGGKSSQLKQQHSQRPASVQGFRRPGPVTKLTFCRPASRQEASVAEATVLTQVAAEEAAAMEAASSKAKAAIEMQEALEREGLAKFKLSKAMRNNHQVKDVHKKKEVVPWVDQIIHIGNIEGAGNPLNVIWSYRLNSMDKTVSEDMQSGNEPVPMSSDEPLPRSAMVKKNLDDFYDGFCVKMDLKETLNRQQGQAESEAKLYWEERLRKQRILDVKKKAANALAIAGRVATPRKKQPLTAR